MHESIAKGRSEVAQKISEEEIVICFPNINHKYAIRSKREEGKMKLPDIGDTITTERALELCKHFKLDYLINRIEASPDRYEIWKFDGCSCLRDKMMGLWTDCPWRDITYKCCLPHDLCYAYGDPGNDIERERVDIKFYSDLVTKAGMKKWMARAFYEAVRIGGKEEFGLSFSWGFAHK